jgi:hypothetical protein
MKKILASLLLFSSLSAHSLSPNEMFALIGAVKYYNENCAGLSFSGMRKMNKGLKRFKLDKTPVAILEQNPLAISGYKTASKFGCVGTKKEAYKAGFGHYIN